MSEPIFTSEMKLILFGDYVAVAWNTRRVRKEINFGGDNFVSFSQEPVGDPYIIFPIIRQIGTGEYYLDDDESVMGGLAAEAARQVAAELLLAAEWLEGNS